MAHQGRCLARFRISSVLAVRCCWLSPKYSGGARAFLRLPCPWTSARRSARATRRQHSQTLGVALIGPLKEPTEPSAAGAPLSAGEAGTFMSLSAEVTAARAGAPCPPVPHGLGP